MAILAISYSEKNDNFVLTRNGKTIAKDRSDLELAIVAVNKAKASDEIHLDQFQIDYLQSFELVAV